MLYGGTSPLMKNNTRDGHHNELRRFIESVEANPTVLTGEHTEEFNCFKTTIDDHLHLIGKVNLWGKWLHHLLTPMLTSQHEFL
jgi:hypothetical protein